MGIYIITQKRLTFPSILRLTAQCDRLNNNRVDLATHGDVGGGVGRENARVRGIKAPLALGLCVGCNHARVSLLIGDRNHALVLLDYSRSDVLLLQSDAEKWVNSIPNMVRALIFNAFCLFF